MSATHLRLFSCVLAFMALLQPSVCFSADKQKDGAAILGPRPKLALGGVLERGGMEKSLYHS